LHIAGTESLTEKPAAPERPPLWSKHHLRRYEETAIEMVGYPMRKARHESVRLRAAQTVLDYLHGKPSTAYSLEYFRAMEI
jgi:hypothetical protein